MLKKFCISIFLFFSAISDLHSTALNEAIDLLYENNNQLRSEKMRIKEARSSLTGIFMSALPDIKYIKSLHQELSLTKLDGIKIKSNNNNQDKTVFSLQEDFSIGNALLDPRRAVKTLDIQKLNYRFNEQNIILQSITVYLDVIKNEEILRVAKENEEILIKYTSLIKRRLDFGEVTKTDLEQSKSRLYSMKSNRIQAEGDFEVSKAFYKKVFGIDPRNLILPQKFPKIPENFDYFKKFTQEQNISLKISKLNQVTAKYDIARAVNNLLPSVSIYASRIRDDDQLIAQNIKEQQVYGIDLKIPLLPRGGSEYARVMQSKYAFNRSYYDYEDYKLELETLIIEAWNNVKTYNASVDSAKSALEFTTLAMNAVKREAEYGSRTTLDVLNSELDNFNANINLIKARYAQVLSYYKLIAIMGQLNKNVFSN